MEFQHRADQQDLSQPWNLLFHGRCRGWSCVFNAGIGVGRFGALAQVVKWAKVKMKVEDHDSDAIIEDFNALEEVAMTLMGVLV